MDAPIFIVGANRSGTTLLRLILNAHSRIAIPEELNYFYSHMAGATVEEWKETKLTTNYFDYVVRTHCAPLLKQGLDVEGIREELLQEEPFTLRRPYEAILEAWAKLHGKKRWGEKTPSNLFYADVLIDMFPGAVFIHLVRDPRAGVASMQRVGFFSDDIIFNALARHKSMTKGRAILEQHVPKEQRMTLRYEDLVHDPEGVVQAICQFIGERYEPNMLEYHRSADRYMKDEAANGFNATATRPISPAVARKWRKKLNATEIALIERLCGSEMREFGYPLEGTKAPWPDQIMAVAKQAYWHWQCWRHRHNRHYTVVYPMFARTRNTINNWRRSIT